MNNYWHAVSAESLSHEELAEVVAQLLERLGLRIMRDATPDYVSITLTEKPE